MAQAQTRERKVAEITGEVVSREKRDKNGFYYSYKLHLDFDGQTYEEMIFPTFATKSVIEAFDTGSDEDD
jgi:hypothetical protein